MHKFHSQTNQDRYLFNTFFRYKTGLTFVEVGAFDGVALSNTLFFEQELGWSGICIEPHPRAFAELRKNRGCICMNVAVGNEVGEFDFLYVDGPEGPEMLSGLAGHYMTAHRNRFDAEAAQAGMKVKTRKVKTLPLHMILAMHEIGHVDYCSVDVEGAELNVLESVDFDLVTIDVFTVENNYGTPDVARYLAGKGYHKYADLGADEVFVRQGFTP